VLLSDSTIFVVYITLRICFGNCRKGKNAYSGLVKFTTKDEKFVRSVIEAITQKDFNELISVLSKNHNHACKKIAKYIQGELEVYEYRNNQGNTY